MQQVVVIHKDDPAFRNVLKRVISLRMTCDSTRTGNFYLSIGHMPDQSSRDYRVNRKAIVENDHPSQCDVFRPRCLQNRSCYKWKVAWPCAGRDNIQVNSFQVDTIQYRKSLPMTSGQSTSIQCSSPSRFLSLAT